MHALGIDPLMDFDITWVMEEYKNMLQQPLPQGWKIVKHLGGAVHYVNLAFSVDTTDHPALKRFRRLVTYLKWAKVRAFAFSPLRRDLQCSPVPIRRR